MIQTMGQEKCLRTLILLSHIGAHSSIQNSSGLSIETIRQNYIKFLKLTQPKMIHRDRAVIEYPTDKDTIITLSDYYRGDSKLNDLRQADVLEFSATNREKADLVYSKIRGAMAQLEKLSPDYSKLIETIVTHIFHAPSQIAGGGSTSNAIGVIWANPKSGWSNQDLIEFLIHESTHQWMFLDELCYRHYTNYELLSKQENFAKSAILKKPRPLDKVLHSLVVGIEILLCREAFLDHPKNPKLHPPTDVLIIQCQDAIQSILETKNVRNLLSERGQKILEICTKSIEVIKKK